MTRATELCDKFYADLAAGVATMDAACAWIRATFDEQCRVEMMMGYDVKCYELAEHFLQDEPVSNDPAKYDVYCRKLAQHIQYAIEDWFNTPGEP